MRNQPKQPQLPREVLRQRLVQLVRRGASEATIDAQIDDLLADILDDEELLDDTLAPQVAPAWADTRDEDSRVVVTGMGVLTPLGIGLSAFWSGLAEGRSGVAVSSHSKR